MADGAVGPDGAHLDFEVVGALHRRVDGTSDAIASFGKNRFQETVVGHGGLGTEAEEFIAARGRDRLSGENVPIPGAEIGRGDCQTEPLLALADRLLGLLAPGDIHSNTSHARWAA